MIFRIFYNFFQTRIYTYRIYIYRIYYILNVSHIPDTCMSWNAYPRFLDILIDRKHQHLYMTLGSSNSHHECLKSKQLFQTIMRESTSWVHNLIYFTILNYFAFYTSCLCIYDVCLLIKILYISRSKCSDKFQEWIILIGKARINTCFYYCFIYVSKNYYTIWYYLIIMCDFYSIEINI